MSWPMPVNPTLERLRQEDYHEFKANLSNVVSSRSAWDLGRNESQNKFLQEDGRKKKKVAENRIYIHIYSRER